MKTENIFKEMYLSFKEGWKENPKEFIGSMVIIISLFAALYFGLWFIAIIEGRV